MQKSLILIIGIVLGITAWSINHPQSNDGVEKKQSVYGRVMASKTIRCGYFIEPPFTMQDPNTGEFSGLSVDLVNAIAEELNLQVEWAEEISFATFPQDLKNNRYDMVCGSIFIMPRAGQMDYSQAYAHVPIQGYVREGDARFDRGFSDIKWNNIKISGLDGEGATTAVQKILPQTQLDILPQLSNISEMLLTVETGKTDIGFVLPTVYSDYNKSNPNRLRPAKLNKPLYTYAVSFGLARGQFEFKNMIDNIITQLHVSGELEALLDKHDPSKLFNRI